MSVKHAGTGFHLRGRRRLDEWHELDRELHERG